MTIKKIIELKDIQAETLLLTIHGGGGGGVSCVNKYSDGGADEVGGPGGIGNIGVDGNNGIYVKAGEGGSGAVQFRPEYNFTGFAWAPQLPPYCSSYQPIHRDSDGSTILRGSIGDFRISKGIARWTENWYFTKYRNIFKKIIDLYKNLWWKIKISCIDCFYEIFGEEESEEHR